MAAGKLSWHHLKPTLPACIVLGIGAIIGLLDALCLLPHPGSLGASDLTLWSAREQCSSNSQVRRLYNKRLVDWSVLAKKYAANYSLADEELSFGNAKTFHSLDVKHVGKINKTEAKDTKLMKNFDAIDKDQDGLVALEEFMTFNTPSVKCDLARESVRQRALARDESRVLGSAGMHLFLMLRDFLVYRSLDPFTFDAMKRQRRKKMRDEAKKRGKKDKITDEMVCDVLVTKSTQSNEGWNKAAKKMEQVDVSYFWGTITAYLGPLLIIVAFIHGLQTMFGFWRTRLASMKEA